MKHFLHTFFDIWIDMAPWLLMGFGVAFLCSWGLSERAIRRHLGGAGWVPILKASVLGLLLPICSCGVLLVGLALRKNGARKAPVCAFLASTPQAGTDALLVSLPILGLPLTLIRLIGAVVAGLVSGALVRRFGIAQPPPRETEDLASDGCAAICACHHHSPDHPHHEGELHHHEYTDAKTRCREATKYAFVHLPGEVAGLLTLGITLAALLATFLPEDALAGVPTVVAYLLAILIGIPTYACSLAILPVAAELISGGLSIGAAFVFMACAPTMHIASLLILGRELGWRTVLWFVLGVVGVAIAIGLLLDTTQLIHISGMFTHDAHHHHHNIKDLCFLLPLALLLLHGIWRTKFKTSHTHSSTQK